MTNSFQVVKSAAEAALGENLLKEELFKIVSYPRKLSSIAYVGSAAIQDTGFDLMAGTRKIGTFWNTQAGASVVPVKEDYKYPNSLIRASEEIQAIVIDAALTNPVLIELTFNPVRPVRTTRSWGNKYGSYTSNRRYAARNWRYR